MEAPIVLPKVKFNALFSFFNDLGYKTSTKIGIEDYRTFLNKNSKTGIFDPDLANKKINVIPLKYYLSFEEFFEKTPTYIEIPQKELSQLKEFIEHINIKIK